MRKDVTIKDVLYAMEYLGEVMTRTPIKDGKAVWTLKSGAKVKDAVAHDVRSYSKNVSSFEDAGREIVQWKHTKKS